MLELKRIQAAFSLAGDDHAAEKNCQGRREIPASCAAGVADEKNMIVSVYIRKENHGGLDNGSIQAGIY